MSKEQLLKEVEAIKQLANETVQELQARLRQPDYVYQRTDKEKEVSSRVKKLDASVGTGCVPGRWLRFSANDGMIDFIITDVGDLTVEVVQIPTIDGYEFEGEFEGKILTGVVRRNLERKDQYNAVMERVRKTVPQSMLYGMTTQFKQKE